MEEKLFKLFKDACDKLMKDGGPNWHLYWIDFCDSLEVLLLHPTNLVVYWNNNEYKNFICITNPENHGNGARMTAVTACPWILIPPEKAEKFVILNYLPIPDYTQIHWDFNCLTTK